MKKFTIFHLEDEPHERAAFKKFKSKLEEILQDVTTNNFLKITIIACKSVKELETKIFDSNYELTKNGSLNILFVIDYYIDKTKSSDCFAEVMSNGQYFSDWLNLYFPFIPKILLTVGDADKVNNAPNFNKLKYYSKSEFNNHEAFARKLTQYFLAEYSTEFWNALKVYPKQTGSTSWHTPGHNRGNSFVQSTFLKDFYEYYQDKTFSTDLSVSVDKLGDLSEPDMDAPLSKAMKFSSMVFGSKDTFFITNGTSTSNKTLLMTLLKPGEAVLVDRNCHKSVHQAIVFSGAIPIYMPPYFNETYGIWAPIDMKTLISYINYEYPDDFKPRMLILTTTTYEGIMYPISEIADLCTAKGILFYADEAWAPYLRFHPYYTYSYQNDISKTKVYNRYNAVDAGAHFVVQSTHKALSAFSQASMIHITKTFYNLLNNLEKNTKEHSEWKWLYNRYEFNNRCSYSKFKHELLETLRYWHSTSPHYPMLASLEKASYQMKIEGMSIINNLLENVDEFEKFLEEYAPNSLLTLEDIVTKDRLDNYRYYKKDKLKICLAMNNEHFKTKLERKKIQWEKSTNHMIQFLATIGTHNEEFQELREVMLELNPLEKYISKLSNPKKSETMELGFNPKELIGEIKVLPSEATKANGKLVCIKDCIDKVSCQMVVPYPPGIPVCLPGMKITKIMVTLIMQAIKYNEQDGTFNGNIHQVHGLYNNSESHGSNSINDLYIKVLSSKEEKSFYNLKKFNTILKKIC